MKYLKSVLVWALLVLAAQAGVQFHRVWKGIEEPAVAASGPSYALIPSDQISRVFKERLRGFPTSQADSLAAHLLALCKKFKLDPALVLGLIEVESSFRVSAVSPMGAVGLMQLMPETARFVSRTWGVKYASPQDLENPYHNLALGVQYLAFLRDRYRGHTGNTLAAYLVGPARIDELLASERWVKFETKQYTEAVYRKMLDLRLLDQILERKL